LRLVLGRLGAGSLAARPLRFSRRRGCAGRLSLPLCGGRCCESGSLNVLLFGGLGGRLSSCAVRWLGLLFRRGSGKLLDAVAITLFDAATILAATATCIQKRGFVVVGLVALRLVMLFLSLTL
jgi:hypothetical protein